MTTTKIIVLLVYILTVQTIFAQNPSVVNGVATYTSDINIGRKFPVPDSWDKIVINENVTITGSFYMGNRSKPIEIMGKNRKTSIIQGDGSRPTDDGINGRSYSAIRCDGSPDLYVHDLTVTRPMKFHIHGGFGKVTVERCDIIAGGPTHTTDGIHGGLGKTIVRDCYIDVYDDALYTAECTLVENTTIVHNKNGGPLMTCWGAALPNKNHTCIIRNVTVISNHNADDYNHGIVSWANRKEGGKETLTLKFEGYFKHIVAPGKVASPMYTFGRKSGGINDSHYIIDGICPRKNSIDYRGSKNCTITFINCEECKDTQAPSVPGAITVGNITFNSVDLNWGASTDDVDVTGYEIYVDGVLKTTSTTNTATISGLNCEKQQSINILAYDACGNKSAKNSAVDITTSTCPPCTSLPTITGGNGAEDGQTAYISMTLPTTILAENVDNGENDVAYYDYGYGGAANDIRPTWSTEHGFRLDSDIEFDEELGNTYIGGINSGEWAEYTVNVPAGGGTYRLSSVKYSTNSGITGKIWFKIGDFTSCLFNLPNTNKVFTTIPIDFEFTLPEGNHVFTWVSEAFGFNLDEFVIDAVTSVAENTHPGNTLKVYPNPVKNVLSVETRLGEPRLFDISGIQLNISVAKSGSEYKLDVEKLSAGIYFIRSGNSVVKVVKE
jgi:hypothetical protein